MPRIPCAIAVLVAAGLGCRFEAPGASTAGGLDDATNAFPIDAAQGDVGFDVARDTTNDSSAALETIDDASLDSATTDVLDDDGPLDVAPEGPPPCSESGATRYGDHCYFVVVDPGGTGAGVDEATAEADCAAATPPAHLATMNTPGEHTVLDAICDPGFHCWVGLQSTKKSKLASDFHWITGETGFDGPWCAMYPNDNGLCATWYEAPPGCYQDIDCAGPHTHVACERD